MINTIKRNGYNLHIFKTDKFKSITVKLIFWNKLKEEELTMRNLLADNLLFSSGKYKDNRSISIKKQDLYSASVFNSTYRNGTQVITEFNLSCIEDKYTEKGNFLKALNFLFECLNNPNVSNKSFDLNAFNITKERLRTAIKNETDNPNYYSYRRYKQIIANKDILNGSILGSIDDLEKITPSSLYEYYETFFVSNHLDIYVLGNVEEDVIESIINKNSAFKFKDILYTPVSTDYKKEFTEDIEDSKFNQSKLIMGGSIKSLSEKAKKYDSIIYNIILGNSPNSKLFRSVREKKSYAYTISSNINRLDGMFTISAGISYDNYEDTKREIYHQLDLMRKGSFSIHDIKNAKEVVLSILKEIDDSPNSMIDHCHNYLYYGADTIKEQIESINSVTKKNIIDVAKSINIDTVYLLKEDIYGKDKN